MTIHPILHAKGWRDEKTKVIALLSEVAGVNLKKWSGTDRTTYNNRCILGQDTYLFGYIFEL